MLQKRIPAGRFKALCLKIMDEVQRTQTPIIITKRDVPVVEMIPIKRKAVMGFGWMRGTGRSKGDITEPINEVWDANC